MSRKAIGKKTVSCTSITEKLADKPALFRRFRQLFFVFGTPVPFPFCESSARLTPGGPILRKCVKRGAAFFWGSGDINKDHPPGVVQIAQGQVGGLSCEISHIRCEYTDNDAE